MKRNLLLAATGLLLFVLCLLSIDSVLAQTKKGAAPASMSDIQTQKQNADSEIEQIQSEIGKNQTEVSNNLAALKQIEADISDTEQNIQTVEGQLEQLLGKIEGLESSIEEDESRLDLLRDEYLKAIKKMRVARKKSSGLVFVFASKSLGEAERRMRYLREFSLWKERQQETISEQMLKLNDEHNQLTVAKEDVEVAHERHLTAQETLKLQQQKQTQVVAQLKANGDALKEHLAIKQAEARKLANQISQLIAQDQAKEAERKRKAAEEKAAQERQLAEQKRAEEKRAAEEKKAQEKKAAEEKAAKERQLAENKKAEQKKTEQKKAEQKKAQEKKAAEEKAAKERQLAEQKKAQEKKAAEEKAAKERQQAEQKKAQENSSNSNNYAQARRRQPRGETGFESMKGSLPRPVNGSFRIVSAFGVHPLSPDYPEAKMENTGIDAHVSKGAAACAVYDGEVLHVYDRSNTPGFRHIIIIKHGDYYTVYANLDSVNVKMGEKVKQGQQLGVVGYDFDNPSKGLIHFEVWKGQTRLDPAGWIK